MLNRLENIWKPVEEHLAKLNRETDCLLVARTAGIYRIINRVRQHRGKQLRPIMLLLAAGANGEINEKTISLGVVADLIHLSSLVHDDVIDMGARRRGLATLNALHDNKTAVLAGDFLLIKCMHQVASLNDPSLLLTVIFTIQEMVEAELFHLRFDTNLLPSQEQYLEIVEAKTASLIALCMELGVSSVSGDSKLVNQWKAMGKTLGTAFQLKDDLLDYMPHCRCLKDRYKDIMEHKITLPLLAAIDRMNRTELDSFLQLYLSHGGREEKILTIIQTVRQAGAITHVEKMIANMLQPCYQFIHSQNPSPYKDALLCLLDFLENRNF
jgi:octaprenyl-diphosphate synthase